MARYLLSLLLLFTLTACSDPQSESTANTPFAPELEGILVTSAAPIVMANLRERDAFLYFLPLDCEACWELLVKADKVREQANIIAVVTHTDNFVVYEKARSHFINLLPIYADHDENIAYDYDVEQTPLWVSVIKGKITTRSADLPTPLASLLTP